MKYLVIEYRESERPGADRIHIIDARCAEDAMTAYRSTIIAPKIAEIVEKYGAWDDQFWPPGKYLDTADAEDVACFQVNIRAFFGARQDLADQYLAYYFSERQTLDVESNIEMLAYIAVTDLLFAKLCVVALDEIDLIPAINKDAVTAKSNAVSQSNKAESEKPHSNMN